MNTENKSDTPESDAAWEYSWDEGGCPEEHLLDTMKKLERERDEARRIAEEGRLGQIPSNRIFPWENIVIAPPQP